MLGAIILGSPLSKPIRLSTVPAEVAFFEKTFSKRSGM
jgi:hypothetical protein